MAKVIRTCAKCGVRYEYSFDGLNFQPCPNCGDDPIGSVERAATIDLIAQLRSSDRSVRNNAAVVLGERRVQEAAEPLLGMLRSKGAEVEVGVIIALGNLREVRAVESLTSVLFEGRDWRKESHPRTIGGPGRIIDTLLRIGTDEALEAVLATDPYSFSPNTLRELAKFGHEKVPHCLAEVALSSMDTDYPERSVQAEAAIASLGEIGGELAISTLKTMLLNPRKGIVLAAHRSLAKIGYKPVDEAERLNLLLAGDDWQELSDMGHSSVPLLAEVLMSSPSRGMRRSAAMALQQLSWIPTDEAQTVAYLVALGKFDELVVLGDIAVNEMLGAMSDKNYSARELVPVTLARMQLRPEQKLLVINTFVLYLGAGFKGWTRAVAVAVAKALGMMDSPDAVLSLIDRLNTWNHQTASWEIDEALGCAVCEALGRLGDARATDVLMACTADKNQWQSVKNAAQVALAEVDPSYALKRQKEEESRRQPAKAKEKAQNERRGSIQAELATESQIERCEAATVKTSTVSPLQPALGKKKWWQFWK